MDIQIFLNVSSMVLLFSLIIMLSMVMARQNKVAGSEDVISDEQIPELTKASFWVFVVYVMISVGAVGFVLFGTNDPLTIGLGAFSYTLLILALALFATSYGITQDPSFNEDPELREVSNDLVKASFVLIIIYSMFVLSTMYLGSNTEKMFVNRAKSMRSELSSFNQVSFFGRRKRKGGKRH